MTEDRGNIGVDRRVTFGAVVDCWGDAELREYSPRAGEGRVARVIGRRERNAIERRHDGVE